jgi:acetyltransferase-like isoleucine patch superfamily enzyme
VLAHPTALVETSDVGEGSRIWAFTHVMAGARIGAACNIGDHCFIESGVEIGDLVTIKNGNMIWEGVTLEDGVFVGHHVDFTNDRYPRSPRLPQAADRYREKATWLVPTVVKRGASIGAGAVILAGCVIGEFAMVAAGSVVSKDVAPYSLVKGRPATWCRWVCACGLPLEARGCSARCGDCGRWYVQEDGVLRPGDEPNDRGRQVVMRLPVTGSHRYGDSP